jgi:hypothetical protein
MNQIAHTISASMEGLKVELEKKQREADVKRNSQMAKLYALADQLKQAREKPSTIHPPPIANLQIPVSTATPDSKRTFTSATSNLSSVKTSPFIPALNGTPPRPSAENPYKQPSPNFKTVGTGERATIIRTIPSSVKYRELAPIEYEAIVNKHRGVIPTGKMYAEAPPYEHNILWIKTVANAVKLSELRSDDDDSDISFAAVGHHFVDPIGLFEKYHTVELYKAFEVKITHDAKDERCIGLFAIRLKSSQGMSEQEQIIKLQQLAQIAIYTQAFLDIEPSDLPQCVSAFTFEINPVNHPNFIIFSLGHGIDPQWWDQLNHIGLRWLLDHVYSQFRVDAQGRQLPKSLERWIDRGE